MTKRDMPLGAGLADVSQEGLNASSFLLCKTYVWCYFYVIHYCTLLFRLIFMLKTHNSIYVSLLKNSFFKKTNGDKLYMFLLLKGRLAQQTNTLLSNHYSRSRRTRMECSQGRGLCWNYNTTYKRGTWRKSSN